MKKIILILTLLFSLCFVSSCKINTGSNNSNSGIIENKLKLEDTKLLSNASIKFMDDDYNSEVFWYITPSGFDYEELNSKGYKMEITVSYEVYYVKDTGFFGDIGYLGSPRYEAYILNDENVGTIKEDLDTLKESIRRTITYRTDIINLINEKIRFVLSTDNIQNIIYFKNIVVSYECYK